jgi:hypothetical protein
VLYVCVDGGVGGWVVVVVVVGEDATNEVGISGTSCQIGALP